MLRGSRSVRAAEADAPEELDGRRRGGVAAQRMLTATAAAGPQEDSSTRFLLLATNRTGTMEDELNEARARGYRLVATQGERPRSEARKPSC